MQKRPGILLKTTFSSFSGLMVLWERGTGQEVGPGLWNNLWTPKPLSSVSATIYENSLNAHHWCCTPFLLARVQALGNAIYVGRTEMRRGLDGTSGGLVQEWATLGNTW